MVVSDVPQMSDSSYFPCDIGVYLVVRVVYDALRCETRCCVRFLEVPRFFDGPTRWAID